MIIRETEKMIGTVMVEKFRDGVLVHRFVERNLMTTLGAALFASLRIGSGTAPSHIAIGTGSTEAAVGDTTLATETARAAATRTTAGALSRYVATFNAGVATGTLREAGLLNAGAAGTLTNRIVFTSPVVKGASEIVVITWTITGSNP